MRYQEYPPAPALRPFVDALWWLTSEGGRAPRDAGTVIPDGSMEIIVAAADPVRPSTRARPAHRLVVGQMERPWRVTYTGVVDLIGIRLHPAAPHSLGIESAALANRVLALSRVSAALDRALTVAGDRSIDRRLADLTARMESVIHGAASPNPVVVAATAAIRRRAGQVRIADLATSLSCSVRRLERLFRTEVGLSPKRWARVIRFQRAFEAAPDARGSWADIAQTLGYADQAHLTREFREFAGVAPRRISSRRR